jgi:hypothetical protein
MIKEFQWRDVNENRRYPFTDEALMTDGTRFIPDSWLLDARLYPRDVYEGYDKVFIGAIERQNSQVRLYFTVSNTIDIAYADFDFLSEDTTFEVRNIEDDTIAGILVVNPETTRLFSNFDTTTVRFGNKIFPLCPSVLQPIPAPQVTALKADTGGITSGDVWLVGGAGVHLEVESDKIVINFVGDPLFKRVDCEQEEVVEEKRFLKTITPQWYGETGGVQGSPPFAPDVGVIGPIAADPYGNFNISAIPPDNVLDIGNNPLRVYPLEGRLVIEVAGLTGLVAGAG